MCWSRVASPRWIAVSTKFDGLIEPQDSWVHTTSRSCDLKVLQREWIQLVEHAVKRNASIIPPVQGHGAFALNTRDFKCSSVVRQQRPSAYWLTWRTTYRTGLIGFRYHSGGYQTRGPRADTSVLVDDKPPSLSWKQTAWTWQQNINYRKSCRVQSSRAQLHEKLSSLRNLKDGLIELGFYLCNLDYVFYPLW